MPDDFQRVNAPKNVLAGIVNGVAAVVFIAVADVAWGPAALIAVGSVAGAQLAARYGRRLSPQALRAVIVIVGLAAIVQLVTYGPLKISRAAQAVSGKSENTPSIPSL